MKSKKQSHFPNIVKLNNYQNLILIDSKMMKWMIYSSKIKMNNSNCEDKLKKSGRKCNRKPCNRNSE